MVYLLSYQLYKYEHGLTDAEQQIADVRAGECAAALRHLWHRLGRTPLPPRGAAAAAVVRFPTSVR